MLNKKPKFHYFNFLLKLYFLIKIDTLEAFDLL